MNAAMNGEMKLFRMERFSLEFERTKLEPSSKAKNEDCAQEQTGFRQKPCAQNKNRTRFKKVEQGLQCLFAIA